MLIWMAATAALVSIGSLILSVGAVLQARRARQDAAVTVRSMAIEAGVTDLAADFAVLRDSVENLRTALVKLRNRQNAKDSREKKQSSGLNSQSDEEWRKWATKRIQLGQPID